MSDVYFKMLREKRRHLQQITRLTRQVEDLERRLDDINPAISTIPPVQIPAQVHNWMKEYGMPWEIFWCYDHHWWCDELDNSFPYFCENTCSRCREPEFN